MFIYSHNHTWRTRWIWTVSYSDLNEKLLIGQLCNSFYWILDYKISYYIIDSFFLCVRVRDASVSEMGKYLAISASYDHLREQALLSYQPIDSNNFTNCFSRFKVKFNKISNCDSLNKLIYSRSSNEAASQVIIWNPVQCLIPFRSILKLSVLHSPIDFSNLRMR